MRRLNRDWRGKDRPTDVLSFAQAEGPGGAPPGLLGDVVISLDTARRQAAERAAPLGAELDRLLIHGVLHLLGYDHERSPAEARRMQRRERALGATARRRGEDAMGDVAMVGAQRRGRGGRRGRRDAAPAVRRPARGPERPLPRGGVPVARDRAARVGRARAAAPRHPGPLARGAAFGLGWITGTVFYLVTCYWIVYTIGHYTALPVPLAAVLLLLMSSVLACYHGAFAAGVAWFERRGLPVVWLGPALWVTLEWLRGWFFIGFPWAALGYSQYRFHSLVQMAEVTGVYGVSAVLVLFNLVVAAVLVDARSRRARRNLPALATLTLLVVALVGFGRWRVGAAARRGRRPATLRVGARAGQHRAGREVGSRVPGRDHGALPRSSRWRPRASVRR